MSFDIEKLYKASYKQVDFLVEGSSVRGGRKDILHEYPNSDKQSVEDLGLKPRSYSLTAVITGENYFEKRNALLTVLEEGGAGILIHPFYGELNQIVARNYSLNENMNSIGAGTITINFDIDNTASVPVAETNTITELNAARDAALDSAASDLEDDWDVSTALNDSFEYAREKLDQFSSAYEDAMEPIRNIQDNVNNLTSLVTEFNDTIIGLVNTPKQLADSVKNLFSSANTISQSFEVAADSFSGLFDFGSDSDSEISPDAGIVVTAANIQKTKNDKALSAAVNQMALAEAYVNYSQLDYTTVEEIDEVITFLKTQSEIEQNSASSMQTQDVMKDLQTKTFSYLNEVRKSAKRITDIEQSSITATRLLSYRAYGDSSLDTEINGINEIKDVSFISGNLRILTE